MPVPISVDAIPPVESFIEFQGMVAQNRLFSGVAVDEFVQFFNV